MIIVSHGDERWLNSCLHSLAVRNGGISLRAIIIENGADPIADTFEAMPFEIRIRHVANRGFAAANNEGLLDADAEFVFFLNPDTELATGQLADVVALLRAEPDIGLLAVRQLNGDGSLYPSLRRFPNAVRLVANAFGVERVPTLNRWLGERDLDLDAYSARQEIDWTTGAAMFVRRSALDAIEAFDERFFLFSEETDLALRLRRAGWTNLHSPTLDVVHFAGKAGVVPRREAQMAFARVQYAAKHFGRVHRALYVGALVLNHALRAVFLRRSAPTSSSSAEASRAALRAIRSGRSPYA